MGSLVLPGSPYGRDLVFSPNGTRTVVFVGSVVAGTMWRADGTRVLVAQAV